MRSGWILMLLAYYLGQHTCWSEGLSCIEVKQPKTQCDVVNISSRAKQPLPRQPLEFDLLMLQINRQSMLYPDGEVTRMLGRITESVVYRVYSEKTLRIPADCQLKMIIVAHAPRLRTVKVSGTNNALNILKINKSAMQRIPSSIRHLQQLKQLILEQGVLDSFNLKPLEGIHNLTLVDLMMNNLRRLEVSKDPKLTLPIEQLLLSHNLLETIDMEFFTPFKWLQELNLDSNRLKQIIASNCTLPMLDYMSLAFNELTQLNFSNWTAPNLEVLNLRENNLIQLPFGIGRFTNLVKLFLPYNQLTILDLQQLQGLRKLKHLAVFNNQLHTVLPDCGSRPNNSCQQISLPALNVLNLAYNFLTSIDFSACDFPSLEVIELPDNRLKRILNLNKFSKLNLLDIARNNLFCLVSNETDAIDIAKYRYDVQDTAGNTTCPTNSSFPHPYERGVICCNQ